MRVYRDESQIVHDPLRGALPEGLGIGVAQALRLGVEGAVDSGSRAVGPEVKTLMPDLRNYMSTVNPNASMHCSCSDAFDRPPRFCCSLRRTVGTTLTRRAKNKRNETKHNEMK